MGLWPLITDGQMSIKATQEREALPATKKGRVGDLMGNICTGANHTLILFISQSNDTLND